MKSANLDPSSAYDTTAKTPYNKGTAAVGMKGGAALFGQL